MRSQIHHDLVPQQPEKTWDQPLPHGFVLHAPSSSKWWLSHPLRKNKTTHCGTSNVVGWTSRTLETAATQLFPVHINAFQMQLGNVIARKHHDPCCILTISQVTWLSPLRKNRLVVSHVQLLDKRHFFGHQPKIHSTFWCFRHSFKTFFQGEGDLKLLLMVQKSGDHQLRLVVYPNIWNFFHQQ